MIRKKERPPYNSAHLLRCHKNVKKSPNNIFYKRRQPGKSFFLYSSYMFPPLRPLIHANYLFLEIFYIGWDHLCDTIPLMNPHFNTRLLFCLRFLCRLLRFLQLLFHNFFMQLCGAIACKPCTQRECNTKRTYHLY